MRALYLATVAVHVVAAAVWLGSMAFVAAVLVPALRGREGTMRAALLADTGRRLRAIVWPLYGVLVATGVVQLGLRGHRWGDVGGALWEGPAGRTLALKLGLFAVTLGVSAAHDFVLGPRATAATAATSAAGGSPAADHGRLCASRLGRVAALLALGIVACAVAYVRGGFPWLA